MPLIKRLNDLAPIDTKHTSVGAWLQGRRQNGQPIDNEHFDFRGHKFFYADLTSVGFRNCDFSHASFYGCKLRSFNLYSCHAAFADFRNSAMTNAEFSDTNLSRASFENADLSLAVFRGCSLGWVDFSRAVFARTAFAGHQVTTGVNLSGCSLDADSVELLFQCQNIDAVEMAHSAWSYLASQFGRMICGKDVLDRRFAADVWRATFDEEAAPGNADQPGVLTPVVRWIHDQGSNYRILARAIVGIMRPRSNISYKSLLLKLQLQRQLRLTYGNCTTPAQGLLDKAYDVFGKRKRTSRVRDKQSKPRRIRRNAQGDDAGSA